MWLPEGTPSVCCRSPVFKFQICTPSRPVAQGPLPSTPNQETKFPCKYGSAKCKFNSGYVGASISRKILYWHYISIYTHHVIVIASQENSQVMIVMSSLALDPTWQPEATLVWREVCNSLNRPISIRRTYGDLRTGQSEGTIRLVKFNGMVITIHIGSIWVNMG